jgi:hypothetical protein
MTRCRPIRRSTGQTVAVLEKPRDYPAGQLRFKRELATSPRMWANGFVVHPPDDKSKAPPCRFAKRLSLLAARGIEIDVSVIARNGGI